MTTAQKVIDIAKKEVGYSRWNDPLTGTKYGRWYAGLVGSSYFGTNGVPYCAMGASWCFDQAGAKSVCAGFPGAYCPTMLNDAKKAGATVDKSKATFGDIVYFDWELDGVTDHVGFVISNNPSAKTMETLEFNTGNGIVAYRTRTYTYISGVVRPKYGTSSGGSSSGGSSSITSNKYATYTLSTILRSGSKGSAVTQLQNRLKELGYNPGTIDGDFGTNTAKAVRSFQSAKKLVVDAEVGENTAKALGWTWKSSSTATSKPKSSWITQISGGNWRNKATTDSSIYASYNQGARVEVVGYVVGQDPYGTGQKRWVKSKNNGKYAWEGLFSKSAVDALPKL